MPYSNDMWPVDYNGQPVTDSSSNLYTYPPLPLLSGDKPIKYIRTLGNVWEWCSDWYDANFYQTSCSSIVVDPKGPEKSYDPWILTRLKEAFVAEVFYVMIVIAAVIG